MPGSKYNAVSQGVHIAITLYQNWSCLIPPVVKSYSQSLNVISATPLLICHWNVFLRHHVLCSYQQPFMGGLWDLLYLSQINNQLPNTTSLFIGFYGEWKVESRFLILWFWSIHSLFVLLYLQAWHELSLIFCCSLPIGILHQFTENKAPPLSLS